MAPVVPAAEMPVPLGTIGLLPPVVAGKLVERFTQMAQRQTSDGDETLTDRELEVLRLMAQGSRNKEIAHELSITERTAKAHVSSILGKLAATARRSSIMARSESVFTWKADGPCPRAAKRSDASAQKVA